MTVQKPNASLTSARRVVGGEYEPENLDRWYQDIANNFNAGTSSYAFNSISGDYTLGVTDSLALVDASAGAVTITLPTAVGISGRRYDIKKIDSSNNEVIVQPDGTETVDGCNPISIFFQYDNMTVVSDGANWNII